jgi:hypothetical protein
MKKTKSTSPKLSLATPKTADQTKRFESMDIEVRHPNKSRPFAFLVNGDEVICIEEGDCNAIGLS